MWELDYKESQAPKNWCFWTVVLEKTFESPLDCKEIQPVCPKGDQSWVFIGRTDVEAEIPILWPSDVESWLIGKDPVAGKDWGQEEKGMTENEMVGWHHWLNGHEFWVNSGSWWWTGRPGVLWFMGSQRVGHDRATELNWTELSGPGWCLLCVSLHLCLGKRPANVTKEEGDSAFSFQDLCFWGWVWSLGLSSTAFHGGICLAESSPSLPPSRSSVLQVANGFRWMVESFGRSGWEWRDRGLEKRGLNHQTTYFSNALWPYA